MNTYHLSNEAVADLNDIWDYTQQRWNNVQAEKYVGGLRRAFERLAIQPERGRPAQHLKKDILSFSVRSHVVFYRIIGNDVLIIRILHQRMDFRRHL